MGRKKSMEKDLQSLTPDEFKDLPVDEPEKSEAEKPAEESTPEKPDESKVVKEEEERVPYSRFEEVNDQLKSVKAEVEALKSTKSERPLTTQEQETLEAKNYLKNMLQEVIKESDEAKAKEEAKALDAYKATIKSMSGIYKDFDEDKVVKYANKHEIDNLETAYWRIKAENKISAETPKPKLPNAPGSGEVTMKEKLDTKSLDIFQAVKLAKEKSGIN